MMDEYAAKKKICDIGKRIWTREFVAGNGGNISVRLGPNRFACTPTLTSKGFLTPDIIAIVDGKGNQIGGSKPRTSEVLLHLEIYHELPEINAVCHAHPCYATAFAISGVPVPSCVLPEVEIMIGQIPLAKYDTPGSKDFAETILPHLRNKANTILLANHGVVCCGKELERTYYQLEELEAYCRTLLIAKQIGSIQQFSMDEVGELMALKKQMGIPDPRLECLTESDADDCKLCGSDEFLRGFSTRPIAGHTPAPDGHGRGDGIAGLPSQTGQPQPATAPAAAPQPAPPAGAGKLGDSSKTARDRAADDEQDRLVQLVTDRIIEMMGKR